MANIENGAFKVPDEAFWGDPWVNLRDVSFEYVGNRKTALLLDGPNAVAIDDRDKLPLAVFQAAPDKDLGVYAFTRKAVLTGVRLEDRLTLVAKAMETPPADRKGSKAASGDGFSGDTFKLEAKSQLGIPWQPGTWVFGVILFDRVSNRIRSRLEQGGGYKDAAVEKFLGGQLPPTPEFEVPNPGEDLPSFEKLPESPDIPSEPGVAISVERVIVSRAGSEAVLYGSFRLPVLQGEFMRVAEGDDKPAPAIGGQPVTAVLPITLVMTRSKTPGTVVHTVNAPTFDPVDPAAGGAEATGYFALDLMGIDGMARDEETYFIYALVGDLFHGPVHMAFVDESSLPGRD